MTTEEKKTRQMPKGGRKGGVVFPRLTLLEAVAYARKLVSKTHTSAQPQDVIFSGVVGAKSGLGKIRISALRQYGFLTGDTASKYSAGDLAKQIVSAPEDELIYLYRKAALNPTIFKRIFDTFHGDPVTKAKLKQRAADLKVHPEETDTCVEVYISSLTAAGLISVEGDRVVHLAGADISTNDVAAEGDGAPTIDSSADAEFEENPTREHLNKHDTSTNAAGPGILVEAGQATPRAVFNVNVTLDSSMDIEKLQKQLELLKRFGAI